MSRYRDNTETVTGLVVKTSEKAVLLTIGNGVEVWVPRSVCVDGDTIDKGDTDLVVQSWFAEKEGLL